MEAGVRVEGEGALGLAGNNENPVRDRPTSGPEDLLQEANTQLFWRFLCRGNGHRMGYVLIETPCRLKCVLVPRFLCPGCVPAACRVGAREAGGDGLPQHDRAVEVHLPRCLQVKRRREMLVTSRDG